MTPSELQELLAALRCRRIELTETIASLDQSAQPVELDQTTQGRLSRIDAISQQQMARAGRNNLMAEITRIDAALARAAHGTYGGCCRCHLPIEIARLRADGAAPLCIDCLKEMAEERRQHGVPSRRT